MSLKIAQKYLVQPDINIFLFLRSFPDSFHRVERDQIKIKGKTYQKLHENETFLEKLSI